jgi:hypothetical protein
MFLLFSLSLLGLLLLSQQFLLPHFTRVPLAGSLLDADELQTKEADLSAAVDQAEDARRAELLPTRDPLFQSLQVQKQTMISPLVLHHRIADIAAAASGTSSGAVRIDRFVYDASGATLTLAGDVRNVGTRSMTVLASFVDGLSAEPLIESFVPPVFTREESPQGFRSPFEIHITLRR